MKFLLPVVIAVLTVAIPAPLRAQNREHQQMVADLRMLHEQVQRLQLTVNVLTERLAATDGQMAQQAEAARKGFADLLTRVDALSAEMSTVRENLYDGTTRISKLTQELDAIRTGLGSVNALLTQIVALLTPPPVEGTEAGAGPPVPPVATPPGEPPVTTPPATPPATPPETTPPGQPVLQPPTGLASPTSYMTSASGFYYAGQFDMAIEAFTEFIERFPDSPDAAEAQFYIGESHYSSQRHKEALEAYATVISRYPDSPRVPDAYYKQGLSYEQLGRRPEAIKNYELLRRQYPESTAAGHATQALIRLDIIKTSPD
jgi:tol-pal system protein YbgF